MRDGTFSLGDFALFSTYLMQVAGMTGFLGFIVMTYQQIGVAFRRGVALMQGGRPLDLVAHHPVYGRGTLPVIEQPVKHADDHPDRLDVIGLMLQHGASTRGIYDITFSLPRGSFTVVVGRVGAGKTTLLRVTLGLLEPQFGEVRWNGQRLERPADFLVPPRAAYTPQVPTLLSGTVLENVLIGLAVNDETLDCAVHTAILDRDVAGFADGLEVRIGVRGMKLSGGQVQRWLQCACWCACQSWLCSMTSPARWIALDIETEKMLWARIFEAKSKNQTEEVRAARPVPCIFLLTRPVWWSRIGPLC